jgi:hypothetical protein
MISYAQIMGRVGLEGYYAMVLEFILITEVYIWFIQHTVIELKGKCQRLWCVQFGYQGLQSKRSPVMVCVYVSYWDKVLVIQSVSLCVSMVEPVRPYICVLSTMYAANLAIYCLVLNDEN